MEKGIIVVDIPDDCGRCKLYSHSFGCKMKMKKGIPSWCPIKQMPEKMKISGKYPQPDGIVPSLKVAWNHCIDEILKGESN